MSENENKSKLVYLVRHGKVVSGHEGRYIGSTDLGLGETGKRQAERLSFKVPSLPFKCFSSPMKRTRETSSLALRNIIVDIEGDPDLREIDFGDFEDMTFDEIKEKYPDHVKKWAEYNDDFSFPGGESKSGFHGRIERTAKRISSLPDKKTVVFAHGGVIRALLCHWLSLGPSNYLLFDVKPASITTMKLFETGGVLVGLDNSISDEEKQDG